MGRMDTHVPLKKPRCRRHLQNASGPLWAKLPLSVLAEMAQGISAFLAPGGGSGANGPLSGRSLREQARFDIMVPGEFPPKTMPGYLLLLGPS